MTAAVCVGCVPGWPGAHHSVDACEDLQEWPGGQDALQPSDTEDEVLVQLVGKATTTGSTGDTSY